ncbi:MAG TPA: MetS family NSS transporter small subunit [Desulfomicrobiaceae bacterium]|nr:MetS family NSS transporter small subunit [Desulfomicrobiaceae bacterium]
MTTSALLMMLFGFGVTWGGAALCISIAMKKK